MFNTRLTLWKRDKKLLVVDHETRAAAEIEIDVSKSRIKRGEATHYEIESISSVGSEYVNKLRER